MCLSDAFTRHFGASPATIRTYCRCRLELHASAIQSTVQNSSVKKMFGKTHSRRITSIESREKLKTNSPALTSKEFRSQQGKQGPQEPFLKIRVPATVSCFIQRLDHRARSN
jgi:hypothetical protein